MLYLRRSFSYNILPQLDANEKLEAKIKFRQDVIERRRERLKNPRTLAMGLDTEALDSQVSEHRYQDQLRREEEKLESNVY